MMGLQNWSDQPIGEMLKIDKANRKAKLETLVSPNVDVKKKNN